MSTVMKRSSRIIIDDFVQVVGTQQAFTCSKSTIEALEKGERCVQS